MAQSLQEPLIAGTKNVSRVTRIVSSELAEDEGARPRSRPKKIEKRLCKKTARHVD